MSSAEHLLVQARDLLIGSPCSAMTMMLVSSSIWTGELFIVTSTTMGSWLLPGKVTRLYVLSFVRAGC